MPLPLANIGEANSIKKLAGGEAGRSRLQELGFVVGSAVTVVSKNHSNLIVKVKDSRFAISREIANRVLV